MNDKMEYSLKQFQKALGRLKEAIEEPVETQIVKDATIQRYEFTFELMWKTLKLFLKHSGIKAFTPRETFKAAFENRWLPSESPFLEMLDDRNIAAHEYDFDKAEEIYQKIRSKYAASIVEIEGVLLNKLQ